MTHSQEPISTLGSQVFFLSTVTNEVPWIHGPTSPTSEVIKGSHHFIPTLKEVERAHKEGGWPHPSWGVGRPPYGAIQPSCFHQSTHQEVPHSRGWSHLSKGGRPTSFGGQSGSNF